MQGLWDLRMKTAYMMEEMRRRAIDTTVEQMKEAARRYYRQGYDNGELTASIRELEELGANMEMVVEIELAVRDEVERGIING